MDRAIAFYLDSNKIRDEIGFTYSDVVAFRDDKLEECHGYIQWLFPNKDPSTFISGAPIVTDQTMEDFHEFHDIVQPRMNEAYRRMLSFYFIDGVVKEKWITPHNHNYLRITRIIKALKIFNLDFAEDYLYHCRLMPLMHNAYYKDIIGETTIKFWQDAHNGI